MIRSPELLQNKIIDFLKSLPALDDTNSRKAFIYAMGLDPQLQGHIPFDVPRAQFVPILVSLLIEYGQLADGRHAIEVVLEGTKKYIGKDKQEDCKTLLQELQAVKLGRKDSYAKIAPFFYRKRIFISIVILGGVIVSSLLLAAVFFQWPVDLLSAFTEPPPILRNERKEPTITYWHAQKTQFEAKIELNALAEAENEWYRQRFNLLLVCMKQDNSIPEFLNPHIQKSELFPIEQGPVMSIGVKFSDEFSKTLEEEGAGVWCHLCLLPKKYSHEDFATITELREKRGGLVFEAKYESIKD